MVHLAEKFHKTKTPEDSNPPHPYREGALKVAGLVYSWLLFRVAYFAFARCHSDT